MRGKSGCRDPSPTSSSSSSKSQEYVRGALVGGDPRSEPCPFHSSEGLTPEALEGDPLSEPCPFRSSKDLAPDALEAEWECFVDLTQDDEDAPLLKADERNLSENQNLRRSSIEAVRPESPKARKR